jgi:hypothetical protein
MIYSNVQSTDFRTPFQGCALRCVLWKRSDSCTIDVGDRFLMCRIFRHFHFFNAS